MEHTYYKPGDYNALCDSCGVKFKASALRKRWDGFMVCAADWETRAINDFIKAPRPARPISWTRSEPSTDSSAAPTYISESIGSQDTTIPTGPSGIDGEF